jgi:hypothetical protein
VAVLAVTGAVVFATLWQRAVGADHRRAEVVKTADDFLGALTNFKAATIQADVARIRAFAVGDFADQLGSFFGPATTGAIQQAQAVSVGRIQSVFVESIDGASATVFGVVNETVTNSSSPNPRTEVLRAVIDLVETNGGWRVDRVDVLQSPDQTSPFGP